MRLRRSARHILDVGLDEGSFEPWDPQPDHTGFDRGYVEQLRRAAKRSGCQEAVVTGRGTIGGRRVAVVVSEFHFLAGTVGREAANRIVNGVRRATEERLPLIAIAASGGTRIQEGAAAFVRMTDIASVVMEHRAAGLPYFVYLRHPTTGGVLASWGSLGHLTFAEPGAIVGLIGPKVSDLLAPGALKPGVQSAENLADLGIVDGLATLDQFIEHASRALQVIADPPTKPTLHIGPIAPRPAINTWESVRVSRTVGRVGVQDVLRHGADIFLVLHGSGTGEAAGPMILALARFDGQPCVVVGQDRLQQHKPLGPGAFRVAQRGMRLADDLRLPLVTVVDTPGADISCEAENGAIAGEIARCIALMSSLRVPRVSVLLGQGAGGGALALMAADVLLVAEHAWLAPLAPEGSSAIAFNEIGRASEMAKIQRIGALDLLQDNVVHAVLPEHPGERPEAFAQTVAAHCATQLAHLRRRSVTSSQETP